VAYAGDGSNDFCPMLKLTENDLALTRSGFRINDVIERRAREENLTLKAKKVDWSDGKDILKAVTEKLQE